MRAFAIFQPQQSRRGAANAGFTLVELMVAMTGGLFLSIVVFALSRDASRFYQRESRVANATLSGVSGFERLTSDLARAGHMSTPNIDQDPRVCNRPQAAWPAMLQHLRAIMVSPAPVTGSEIATAGITPQSLVISGALDMTEELLTNGVGATGAGGWQIFIDLAEPSAARIGLSPQPSATGTNLAVMQSVFMTPNGGKIVRLRSNNVDLYAIAGGVATSPGEALVNLSPTPALQRARAGGGQCGINGDGTGMALSVIDIVRYDIRQMKNDSTYAALFKASGLSGGGGPSALDYEGGRAELVRVELAPNGNEIDATREIVGEYAVDLQLSPWGATNSLNPTVIPITATLDNSYTGTQLLRGMHVRLSVRSREADREGPVVVSGSGGASANDHYRMPLTLSNGSTVYSRVRTFQSDVPLRNLEKANW